METIFVDACAFIALSVGSDDNNRAATRLYRDLTGQGATLLTTNHIIDETCTWFLRRVSNGHRVAVRFGHQIAQAAVVTDLSTSGTRGTRDRLIVVYSTPEIERSAWDIFARHENAGFSFTDCVSFAAMQTLGIKKAFTFDNHFDAMGFERL